MAGKGRRHRNSLTTLQSKGEIAMHDLNRMKQLRDSSHNRLQRDVTEIESQEVSSIISIKRDQRLLKEKLVSVRQSTGHFAERRRNAKGPRHKSVPRDGDVSGLGTDTEQHEISRLPSLIITDNEKDKSTNIELQGFDTDPVSRKLQSKNRSSSLEGESNRGAFKQSVNLPEMSKLSRSESTLHNTAWYADLSHVRSTINQRLSISMNELNNANPEKELEPYLYAPPDGLPRTMYLMPSMDERFKQAMKARYIRKPGTRIDPIERELNIKEIFDRSNYGK